ncbi:MAG: 3'-5' exonuclease [Bacteroidetes bacterium]|jgi:DNA polymerase elongation subunit (family B)|nr:3'-5' exonuclease [Bacteroidota bacterium]
MYNSLQLENILFLDIETVPAFPTYSDVPDEWKKLWDRKAIVIGKSEDDTPESLYNRAGIYAEFGKIICISVGYLKRVEGKEQFRIKSFYGDDEKTLLINFGELLNKHFSRPEHRLCGHNAKEFDFPWIARRMVIHGINLPALLDTSGKKPWETTHLDTMEMWKFGDYKNHTSLNLLAALFGIPTPKDDIDGSQVHKVYYEEKNLERIVTYCQKDVLTVVQLLKKYRGENLISDDSVVIQ